MQKKMRIKMLYYKIIESSKTGGGSMNQYYEYVEGLQKLLKERKVCSSSRISHENCYDTVL